MTQVTLPPKQAQPLLGTPTLSAHSAPPPALEGGLKTRLADLASQASVPGKIACYGFDTPRGELCEKLTDEGVTLKRDIFTMNKLNAKVGINFYTAADVLRFVHSHKEELEELSIPQRVELYCRGYIYLPTEDSLEGKWLYFLMKNLSTIDIIGKLVELAQEAKKRPAPSLPDTPSRLEYVRGSERRLKEVLESFIRKNDKWGTSSASVKRQLLAELPASPTSTPSLDSILTRALFRQTSKLGLQFCAQQKIPVAFSWERYVESSSRRTGWLTVPPPKTRRSITAFVPITGSEMRMVSSEPLIEQRVIKIKKDFTEGDVPQPPHLQRAPKLPPPESEPGS